MRKDIEDTVVWRDKALEYANRLVFATRPEVTKDLEEATMTGCSVRAVEWTLRLARAKAYMDGCEFVTGDHIRYVFPDVVRHRLIMKETAQFNGWTPDRVVETVLATVPILN
jgi:MoxR-like ATPase